MGVSENSNGEKGLVFNIQRFSIHDGPGIRTTVFLKGCPLKCPWCSNPESKIFTPNLIVRDINCKGCGECIKACPEEAISISEEKGRRIDWEKCNHCLKCVDVCIYESLNECGTYMDVQEVVDEVIRDTAFYKNSGGGVTLSGGEIFSQIKFSKRLLMACKRESLHTVIDTTGYSKWKDIEGILQYVDLILWDIKHLDPKIHKATTGVGNSLILENLENASKVVDIWLRIPLIAGFNDSEEHIRDIVALAEKIGAKKISLLPYHEGGRSKTEQLGKPYEFLEATAPSEEHVNSLKSLIEGSGIKVAVGN